MVKDEDILLGADIWSKLLFEFYRLSGEVAFNCELPFILQEEQLIKLVDYFGGTTITIPTRNDLKNIAYALDAIENGSSLPIESMEGVKYYYDLLKSDENEL